MNSSAGELTIDNALVFDGWSDELQETCLYLRDGVVEETGARVTRAERVLDARGRTVLPGLIDAHFHAYGVSLDNFASRRGRSAIVALAGARRLERALRRGFTTVRDVAGGDIGLARAVESGLILSPRYLYTGPALSQTGGHGDGRPAELDAACTAGT